MKIAWDSKAAEKRNNEMRDYTIYALKYSKKPDRDAITYDSLQKGVGRFGWSYEKTADLKNLQRKIDERP